MKFQKTLILTLGDFQISRQHIFRDFPLRGKHSNVPKLNFCADFFLEHCAMLILVYQAWKIIVFLYWMKFFSHGFQQQSSSEQDILAFVLVVYMLEIWLKKTCLKFPIFIAQIVVYYYISIARSFRVLWSKVLWGMGDPKYSEMEKVL